MIRLFVAVDLGKAVESAVAQAVAQQKGRAPHAKWARPEASHVTLAFLGHRPQEFVAKLEAALTQVAARHGPFALEVSGAGTFGGPKQPRVLWLALQGDLSALAALHSDVERALTPLGYHPEQRPFSPHLTLARARDEGGDADLAECAQSLAETRGIVARVEAVTLFRSDLTPKGARHTALVNARFAGPLTPPP